MKGKRRKVKQILAGILAAVVTLTGIPSTPVFGNGIKAVDSKIEMFDFGAQQFDENLYHNWLTEDVINSWYPGVEAGTTGKNIASFDVKDKDGQVVFAFNDGGFPATHRLRTSNTKLTRFDEKELSFGSEVLTGYIYSNKGSTAAVNVKVNLNENDIMKAYVASNSANATIAVKAPSGEVQTFAYTYASGNKRTIATEIHVVAKESGLYTIYSVDEKLVLGRVTVEHTQPVEVKGSFLAEKAFPSDAKLVFTNQSSGVETVADIVKDEDGNRSYSVVLNEQFDYKVTLQNAEAYAITKGMKLTLTKGIGGENFTVNTDIEANEVDIATVTGKVVGLNAKELKNAKFSFLNTEKIFLPSFTLNEDGTFELVVEKGVTYDVSVTGVDDYNVVTTSVSADGDMEANIELSLKPLQDITLVGEGIKESDFTAATFTFTRHSDKDVTEEEDYVYTFEGASNVKLRDGVYSVKVTGVDAKQRLTSNLVVKGEATTKAIKFDSEVSSWTFTDASFTAAGYADTTAEYEYNGLIFNGGKSHNNTYLYMGKGEVKVPVKAGQKVQVTSCYQYSFYFDSEEEESVNQKTNSTDRLDTFVSKSAEADGYVTIITLGTSYINKIEVLSSVEYKDTLQVGKDKTYKTVSEAIAAVRNMERPNNERVTIEIDPGNYEEMIVVDVPNVSLVNAAGEEANTDLTNKGVDISDKAVRITWYYGHGYSYYSMNNDCKFDAEVLAVNKENGYESFTNPGAGTTAGSYWNATVVVSANGFEAKDIIFENSFNQYASAASVEDVIVKQSGAKEGTTPRSEIKTVGDTTVQDKKYVERAAALALYNNVKEASFDGCKIIGRQDTLYGGTGTTAAFYDCAIYGGTDYICGGMTAVFAKCDLVANTMKDSGDVFYITAAQQKEGRGYLMYNCNVVSTTPGVDTASTEVSKAGYFGRPWQANTAEVVFYKTNIGVTKDYKSLIAPQGWLSTLGGTSEHVFEIDSFEQSGLDNTASRVNWSKLSCDEEDILISTYFGEWDAFAGKNMTIEVADIIEPEGVIGIDKEGTITNTYTFESKNLTAFAADNKNNGKTEKAGTDNYFELIYSDKSKVDSSSKEFVDAYKSDQRVNFGGTVSTEKNAIKITTTFKDAKVKVWWAAGDANRQIAILDSKGDVVTKTDVEIAKNATCVSNFAIADAGTYYIGSTVGNNYIFKVEVVESATYVWEESKATLDAMDMAAFAAGTMEDGAEVTDGTDKRFTIIYSTSSKIDASSKTYEDGYAPTQRINFGGGVSTSKNAIKFKTDSKKAQVTVWWAAGDNNRQMAILDKDGNVVAKTNVTIAKNSPCKSTLTVPTAGTYYLGGLDKNNYIFKVEVLEKKLTTGAEEKAPRKAWGQVTAPVITDVVQNGNDVNVSVDMEIGYDGADFVEVTLTSDDKVYTKKTSKEGSSVVVTLNPEASAVYTVSAKAERDSEEIAKTTETKSIDFILPLTTPSIKSATNLGGGDVEVEWDAVNEAESYTVFVNGTQVDTVKGTSIVLRGQTVGTTIAVTVKASADRRNDSGMSQAFTVKVVDEIQRKWAVSTYGSSTDSANNGVTGSVADGSVTVKSLGGKGKIVPNSTDGLTFYYTVMNPETENFTLEADVTVDEWTFSNGQEGFGLMVSDSIGTNGNSNAFWNNSIQVGANKIEYNYDVTKKEVTTDTSAPKITMKLGLGAIVKLGVEKEETAGVFPNGATLPANFTTNTYTLETMGGSKGTGTYNIIGNCKNGVDGTIADLTTIHLSLQRNNTGIICRYSDASGNVIGEKLIYDLDRNELTRIEKDKIYVGFFASRNAKMTATNIKLTTINPKDDETAAEREIEYIEPNYTVESATVANSKNYDLVFYGNADGKLSVVDAKGNSILANKADAIAVNAKTKVHIPTTLVKGNNTFKVSFTPNADFKFTDYSYLKDYGTKTISHTVSWKEFAGNNIYVAPNAKETGKGTKADPVSIYEAVKYVKAGQKILLAGGTYDLTRTLKTERGIDGTEDAMIYMIANPDATERPVFDFGGRCAGTIFAGDYWFFQGFDVTNSANGQKGIQLSGSNNTLLDLRTYKNGNTGLQVSRYLTSDLFEDWPANNTIMNCTSFLNADKGYEDADGFAAKLTIGNGNVFDGCVAAYNADDGWDLFAKAETGPIGKVTIKNSVAFKNGYVLDANGKEINAGNGNGFKMGGESITGNHELINSVAFANKAKGIDSNSCPDIKAINSISFDNENYNVAFYTNNAVNTSFAAKNIISYKVSNSIAEQLKLKGTQTESDVKNATNFFVNGSKDSSNTEGKQVADDWFVSMDSKAVIENAVAEILAGTFGLKSSEMLALGVSRDLDGYVSLGNFLKLTENAPEAPEGMTAYAGLYASEKAEVPAIPVVIPDKEVVDDNNNNGNNNNGNSSAGGNKGPIQQAVEKVTEIVKEVVEEVVNRVGNIIGAIFGGNRTPAPVIVDEETPKADNNSETSKDNSTNVKEDTTQVEDENAPLAPEDAKEGSSFPVMPIAAGAVIIVAAGVSLFVFKKKNGLLK